LDQLKKSINNIKNDTISGSTKILEDLIITVKDWASKHATDAKDFRVLQNLLIDLSHDMGAFPVVQHFINTLLYSPNTSTESSSNFIFKAIEKYQNDWKDVNESIASNLSREVNLQDKSVLLHSYSNTISQVFICLKQLEVRVKIFQTEARPMLEGRKQAEILNKLGYQVEFFVDAMLSKKIKESDIVLLGADSYNDHFFTNKIGSYSIAIHCDHYNKPLFVMTDSRKKVDHKIKECLKPGNQVWAGKPHDISISNYYFESVPRNLITKLITEEL